MMTTPKKKQYIMPAAIVLSGRITPPIALSIADGKTEINPDQPGGTPADDGGGRAKEFDYWEPVGNVNPWED